MIPPRLAAHAPVNAVPGSIPIQENHKPVRFIDFEFYSDCSSRLNKSPPQSIHMQVVTLSQGPLNPVPQNGPPPAKSGGGVAASTRP
ncbi:hypothetical protein MTP99_017631 [Tenebrio molitor]|nr:hypothetical protein MTP99_017631 [Tenebrio molitor]